MEITARPGGGRRGLGRRGRACASGGHGYTSCASASELSSLPEVRLGPSAGSVAEVPHRPGHADHNEDSTYCCKCDEERQPATAHRRTPTALAELEQHWQLPVLPVTSLPVTVPVRHFQSPAAAAASPDIRWPRRWGPRMLKLLVGRALVVALARLIICRAQSDSWTPHRNLVR